MVVHLPVFSVTDSFLTSGALNFCRQLSKLNLSKTNVSDKGLYEYFAMNAAL
jgi:hypothetical protein